ncbi:putative disease resistance protein At3g14460 [Carex rostrata]
MHDLAKSVSLDICYCQEEDEWSLQNHDTVRHLSVYRKQIELIDNEISKCKKLRSLLFIDGLNYETKLDSSSLRYLFNELPYLRVLDLWCCKIEELPENIGNLKLLFHLNLKGTEITSLPESICRLYNLQLLYLDGCPIESFPKLFTNLINLRIITEEMEISSMIPRIGKLISLKKLPEFNVLREDGHGINELKNMTRLRDCIKISKLENVKDKKDAAQACLNKKKHLTSLTLSWSMGRNTNPGKKETFIDEDILEGLEPHPNLEQLNVNNYGGIIPASWLKTENLPSLHVLGIKGCSNLKSLKNWLVPCQLLSLRSLEINCCVNLDLLPVEWIGSSSINWLIIKNCPWLKCPNNLTLPSSLSHLELDSCGMLDKSLPGCLMKVPFLKSLKLYNCQHVTSLPSQIIHHVRSLVLSNCAELQYLELSNPSIMEMLSIVKCTKLIRADDPSATDNKTPLERIKQLHTLVIDNTSLLKLPFLRNPPHSVGTLIIRDSTEESIFTRDVQGWLNGPENLVQLILRDCPNFESSSEELHAVINVKWLQISNCPKLQSIPYCHL